jgi:hypothetical protein
VVTAGGEQTARTSGDSHLACGDEVEVLCPVAGEPAVHAGRHVDDATLHAGPRRRLRHTPDQQLRQQEMPWMSSDRRFKFKQ